MQGPIIASTVTAYAVNPASGADLRVLATTKTDASGDFTLRIAPRIRPLRLTVSGGLFVSEEDGSSDFQQAPWSCCCRTRRLIFRAYQSIH